MCVVCIDWQKGKLTAKEALRNLGEIMREADPNSKEFDHYNDSAYEIFRQMDGDEFEE